MGELLESFLRVAMTVFIVGPLITWIARRGARERREAADGTERFTVRTPSAVRMILAVCAIGFELLMLVVYIWQGLSLGIWDHELMWLGHAMALVGLGVWALTCLPRLDVDGDQITFRNALGMRRRAAISQITHATLHTQMMSIALFAGERKFASVSLESVGSSNLLMRLAEEGIDVEDAVEAPMTKGGLCWAAVKPLTLAFNGIAAAFSLVMVIMALVTDEGLRLLLMVPFLFILVGGVLPLFMLSMPLRGLLEIGRQERELGFSFAREMAARGATGTELEDGDWFVSVSNARIVAFRRDYLKSVSAPEGSESGDRCTVTTRDGRKLRVYAAGSTLEDLRSWFKRGAKKKTMAERAEDALETLV